MRSNNYYLINQIHVIPFLECGQALRKGLFFVNNSRLGQNRKIRFDPASLTEGEFPFCCPKINYYTMTSSVSSFFSPALGILFRCNNNPAAIQTIYKTIMIGKSTTASKMNIVFNKMPITMVKRNKPGLILNCALS